MIYFTSDTHFGHNNIIKYCNRPYSNIDEHDQALVDNWCSVVQKGDTVYHLGDFGYTKDSDRLRKICNKLSGQIMLIRGNHDTNLDSIKFRFKFIKDTHLVSTKIGDSNVRVFLSHYPHRTWIHRPRDCYHLFGHVHGNLGPHGLSFDAGVDCWNYKPISIVQVHEYVQEFLMPTWNSMKSCVLQDTKVEEDKL